jgi:hypothetical protein
MIERFHLQLRLCQKLRFRQVLKPGMPGHGQVRTVHLKNEAGGHDGFVLRSHRFRYGLEIQLHRGVIAIGLKRRDHPGRCSVHKRASGAMGRNGLAQVVDVRRHIPRSYK